uniref:Strictosidine synthase conserved region domain-containing protein n=1 Tax=Ananas comosus var. bracteatus TaxID=296719 RepID=A0A6V7NF59_ANACO|nr:unnamed protein product [Ananas comosus var. bracteatus]
MRPDGLNSDALWALSGLVWSKLPGSRVVTMMNYRSLDQSKQKQSKLDKCRGSQDPKREHECGRPLGLQFNERTGELYVADAYLGLRVVVDPDGEGKDKSNATRPIATQAQGLPFRFTNSLDIDQDSGVIYFTDSSTRFQRREFMSAVISRDKTGRLMKYDPKKKEEIQVLADGLSFPNGLALSKNGSFLLIAETTTCRILRYWLRKPHAATPTLEVVAQLPGSQIT